MAVRGAQMSKRIAIVGSGPTGIYALQELLTCSAKLHITIFERSEIAGKGTPYQRGINDPSMLSNIPSVEIPPLPQTLYRWLLLQSDKYLAEYDVTRDQISDRAFYPRIVVGDYFKSQFSTLIDSACATRHEVQVSESCEVEDITPVEDMFKLTIAGRNREDNCVFDYVVAATGHSFPTNPEKSPGFFEAPWPATALKTIPSGEVAVLGTSLSAIDAIMTVATTYGKFRRTKKGILEYRPSKSGSCLHMTMMSRKGLLPEADFYFPIPYLEPRICTKQAVDDRTRLGSSGLLDDLFDLFKQEIAVADPEYAAAIGLDELTVDDFAEAYYGVRDKIEPFEWARQNLVEAGRNYSAERTVQWRYAILITHEIIEAAVDCLNADDLERFNRSFKSIFADDYATVPHLSIERLLALHECGRLEILALGNDSEISSEGLARGVTVNSACGRRVFDTFIDATGQKNRSAADLPFRGLVERGLISEGWTVTTTGNQRRTGGIDLDAQCRPLISGTQPIRRLFFPAVAYLLHKRPFIQGITSAAELGKVVAHSIIADVTRPQRSRRRSVKKVQILPLEAAA
jgi:uncharacterized NAD(P)/FAD-binding protein YdhS